MTLRSCRSSRGGVERRGKDRRPRAARRPIDSPSISHYTLLGILSKLCKGRKKRKRERRAEILGKTATSCRSKPETEIYNFEGCLPCLSGGGVGANFSSFFSRLNSLAPSVSLLPPPQLLSNSLSLSDRTVSSSDDKENPPVCLCVAQCQQSFATNFLICESIINP